MENTIASDGAARPNRYVILSDVITAFTHENQPSIAANITPDATPYWIDSSVTGFPHGA